MNTERYSLRVRSGGRTLVSCDGFIVPQNTVTFLFGESGIGKSILCKALYGLLDPDELDVTINGRRYADHLRDTMTKAIFNNSFFVFQEPSSHLNPLIRISDQLSEGSLGRADSRDDILRRLWQTSDDAAISTIISLYPKPYRPSGGEKQRVLLAMAFEKIDLLLRARAENQPTFFVFDEPTGSLDNNYRNLFIQLLLEKYSQFPFTILFITHDYSIISELYAHYRPLLHAVHFKELSRIGEDGAVEMNDFSAEDYLLWLRKASPPQYGSGDETKEVLRVSPRFSIFGRKHLICSDPARTHEAPLVIRSGEMVYVKAASGVGKTTLAKIILGLYRPDDVAMTLSGLSLTQATPASVWTREIWGKKAGMVFQLADESLDLAATIKETFQGLPAKQKLDTREITSALAQLFDKTRLTEGFLRRKVAFLSGGQKQRLNLLRSLVLATDLIVLDEPLNGLDFRGVTRVLGVLEEKRKNGKALLLISHNEEIFDSLVDAGHTYYLT